MFFMLIAVADSIVILLAFVLHFDSVVLLVFLFFFFNDPAPTDIYPLPLPHPLPISLPVALPAPPAPAVASTGKNILVQVHAQQLGGLARIGFIIVPRAAVVDPTVPPTDSLVFTPPARQPPDTTYTDTLTVQAGFTTFTVTGFAVDAAGRPKLTNPVTVTVQTPGTDVTPPTVSHTISSRIEVNDNLTVHATDPSGIKVMGFRVD